MDELIHELAGELHGHLGDGPFRSAVELAHSRYQRALSVVHDNPGIPPKVAQYLVTGAGVDYLVQLLHLYRQFAATLN